MLQYIRTRLAAGLSLQHHNARILAALASVVTWIALAKVAGAAKEVVVASRYGIGPNIDAYVFVFNFVSWPVAITLSVFTVSVLPILIQFEQEAADEVRLFCQEFLGITIGISILFTTLMCGVLVVVLHWNVTRLSLQVVDAANRVYLPMLLVTFLGVVSSFLAVRLMAQFKHLNSLIEGAPALLIFLIVILTPNATLSSLVWATAAGAAAQCALLVLAQGRKAPLERPRFGFTSAIWPSAIRAFSLLAGSQAVLSLSDVIDQMMVAHVGVGSNATLGYANRLLALVLGLGATGITRSLLPVLSDLSKKGDAFARTVATQWMSYMFFAGAIVAVVGWILTPWAVELLFQRGAFTAANTVAVSETVRAGLLQLPVYFAGIVLVQFTASRADYLVFFYVNLMNFGVKVLANYLFIDKFGVKGAMYSSALVYVLATTLLFGYSRRAVPARRRIS